VLLEPPERSARRDAGQGRFVGADDLDPSAGPSSKPPGTAPSSGSASSPGAEVTPRRCCRSSSPLRQPLDPVFAETGLHLPCYDPLKLLPTEVPARRRPVLHGADLLQGRVWRLESRSERRECAPLVTAGIPTVSPNALRFDTTVGPPHRSYVDAPPTRLRVRMPPIGWSVMEPHRPGQSIARVARLPLRSGRSRGRSAAR
jgi:hypothetical protein